MASTPFPSTSANCAHQKFTVSAVELESMTARNAELIRELEMYKSASVPLDDKPRTIVTRISRPPLSVLNQSTAVTSGADWEKANVESFPI